MWFLSFSSSIKRFRWYKIFFEAQVEMRNVSLPRSHLNFPWKESSDLINGNRGLKMSGSRTIDRNSLMRISWIDYILIKRKSFMTQTNIYIYIYVCVCVCVCVCMCVCIICYLGQVGWRSRESKTPLTSILNSTLNNLMMTLRNVGVLGNTEYPLISIAPMSTLARMVLSGGRIKLYDI